MGVRNKLINLLAENVSIINIGLRGLSLIGRFALLFTVSAKLSDFETGIITYLLSWLPILVIVSSFECFIPLQRSIADGSRSFKNIGDQFILNLLFIVFVIICFSLLQIEDLSTGTKAIFLAIFVTDFFLNEVSRYYIFDSKTLVANLIYFSRQGLSSFIAAFLTLMGSVESNTGILSVILSINSLTLIILISTGNSHYLKNLKGGSFKRARALLVESLPYFISSFTITFTEKLDKILATLFFGPAEAASYNIISSICMSLSQFLYAGVLSVYHRTLLLAFTSGQESTAKRAFATVKKKLLIYGLSGGCCVILVVFLISMLKIVEIKIESALGTSLLLVSGVLLINLSRCCNYALIGVNLGWKIAKINFITFITFLIFSLAFVNLLEKNILALLFLFSAIQIYIMKYMSYFRVLKQFKANNVMTVTPA